jgi:hypothetical protein
MNLAPEERVNMSLGKIISRVEVVLVDHVVDDLIKAQKSAKTKKAAAKPKPKV